MQGADSIKIAKDLPIWSEHGWHDHAGVVVVVGVKKSAANTNYTLVLTSASQYPESITRMNIGSNVQIDQYNGDDARLESRVYQFYNWEHKDVILSLSTEVGNATIMYQRTGQKDYNNNIFTAIPYT